MGHFLCVGQLKPQGVSQGGEESLGSQNVLLVDQDIQVAGLPDRDVPMHERGLDGSFIWNGGDPVCLDQTHKLEEFTRQERDT